MFVVGTHLPVRDRRLRSALASEPPIAATVGVLAVGRRRAARRRRRARSAGYPRGAARHQFRCRRLAAVAGARSSDRAVLVTTAWIAIADVATVYALPVILATGRLWRVVLGGVLV